MCLMGYKTCYHCSDLLSFPSLNIIKKILLFRGENIHLEHSTIIS